MPKDTSKQSYKVLTEFQEDVDQEIQGIPLNESCSYSVLKRYIGEVNLQKTSVHQLLDFHLIESAYSILIKI